MPVSGSKTGSGYGKLRDVAGMIWSFGLTETVKEAVKDLLFDNSLRDEAHNFAKKHGKNSREQNALRHAYWQAIITFRYSEKTAEHIGNAHEYMDQDIRDSVADRHNNQAGRNIGKKVRAMGKSKRFRLNNPDPTKIIEKQVLDAFKKGDLIVDFNRDPRVDAKLEETKEMNRYFLYPQKIELQK